MRRAALAWSADGDGRQSQARLMRQRTSRVWKAARSAPRRHRAARSTVLELQPLLCRLILLRRFSHVCVVAAEGGEHGKHGTGTEVPE